MLEKNWETSVNEVSCGYVGIEGVKVIVPVNCYEALISRIKSFDISKWSNNYYLNNFLSRRCDSKFLESLITSNPQFIQKLKVNSPIDLSDIDVIARLFSFNLLPESERLRAVTAISDLAIDKPDSGFLRTAIKSLMMSDELSGLLEKIETELIPNLDEKIAQWQNEYSRESGYFLKDDPEQYFNRLKNALEDYRNEFEENEIITEKIDNALKKIDLIVEKLKSESHKDKNDDDELFNRNMQEKVKNNQRSIFDDVDL